MGNPLLYILLSLLYSNRFIPDRHWHGIADGFVVVYSVDDERSFQGSALGLARRGFVWNWAKSSENWKIIYFDIKIKDRIRIRAPFSLPSSWLTRCGETSSATGRRRTSPSSCWATSATSRPAAGKSTACRSVLLGAKGGAVLENYGYGSGLATWCPAAASLHGDWSIG